MSVDCGGVLEYPKSPFPQERSIIYTLESLFYEVICGFSQRSSVTLHRCVCVCVLQVKVVSLQLSSSFAGGQMRHIQGQMFLFSIVITSRNVHRKHFTYEGMMESMEPAVLPSSQKSMSKSVGDIHSFTLTMEEKGLAGES